MTLNKELQRVEELIATSDIDGASKVLASLMDHESESHSLIQIGDLYYKMQNMGEAMNCFLKALELEPENQIVKNKISMISSILQFRYKDLYNP
ncbi:MAG: tetratricopeptide repeat protein [Bacteroidota bacterium]|nr:tetratricopeptide repeat protein [Bacteroidota bacterium]MDP4204619.1 tetratricopeptide repeat protein [Bacteroidota bacterium]